MVRIRTRDADLHGVVVIDKSKGPTSHDVVAGLRRTLGTRAVGHAGTLDPAASGVLVVAVGEATKLVLHLTSQEKVYAATITFGRSTNTLDAEGEVTETGAVPVDLARELADLARSDGLAPLLAGALERERARTEQVPPAFSALKQKGRSVHERARRGESVELAPRPVRLVSIEITGASVTSVDLDLRVSKGYYVRALARDLGATLGVPAHLSALRRLSSGPFTLAEALPPDATRDALVGALEPVARAAARVMPTHQMSTDGALRARRGQALSPEHFVSLPAPGVSVWIDPAGALVAIGRADDAGRFAVERGFVQPTSSAST